MSDPIPSTPDPSRMNRLRIMNTVMALVILLLLGQIVWRELKVSSLTADLEQSQRDLMTRVERIATEKLQANRAEMVSAVSFVDDLYRSPDGLMRPDGLYIADAKRVDAEAIGTWVLDVYLQARIAGKSDTEARQAITDAIKGSDEWRRKHPNK